MDCRDCESILVEYALGDLPEDRAEECRGHLEQCASCREALEFYAAVEFAIVSEPMPEVSRAETEAVVAACLAAQVPVRRESPSKAVGEFVGFALASAAAFAFIALVVGLRAFGLLGFRPPGGYLALAPVVILVVFVVTFIPIAVTARRHPLNGMTFRR